VKLRYVGNAPFFSALSEQEQERVSERLHLEHHRSGATLFRKGDASGALYLIKSGWVRLLANGGLALANQGPGSLVGETDLFLDSPRSLTAVTASEVELWALAREDLIELITETPAVGLKLSLSLGSRLALFDRYLLENRLKPLPFLSGLKEDSLLAFASRLVPVEKKEGEFVVEAGQPPQGLYILEAGQLYLLSSEEGGDFSELGPGESFGEMAVLTGKPHARSAQAAGDAVLWCLPAAEFEALSDERPEIRLSVSRSLREHLRSEDLDLAVERLTSMPLFEGLPEEALWAAASRLLLQHVPAGQYVFSQGAAGDALYLVDSGKVEIVSGSGLAQTVLARLGADEFFGEMALLTGKPRSSSARAVAHSNLWVLYRSDFDDLVNRYPAISLALSKALSERLATMDRRFTETHLRGLKLLAGLSASQLEDVSGRLRAARFRQGEAILREGEPGEEMYFLESGRVQVVRGHGAGATVLDELGAGDLFGEMALLTGNARSATVTALSEVNVWTLSRADFDQLVTIYPHLALALSRLLSERLRATDERFLKQQPQAAAMSAAAPPRRTPAARRPAWQAVETIAAPVSRPAAKPKPAPRTKPVSKARAEGQGFGAEVGQAFNGLVGWFGALSPAAKVRLLVVTMLIAWLVCIAAPALVLSTLAADNVTNLQGAIAFVQTATPVPVAEAPSAETAEPEPVVVTERLEEIAPLAAEALPAGSSQFLAAEAPQAGEPEAAVQVAAATPTPWIIVVTNTPPPPTEEPLPTDTPLPPTPAPTRVVVAAAAPARVAPTATPAVAADRPQPARDLDPRLGALGVNVQPAGVQPGQSYWRLVAARWEDEGQAGGRHSIYVNVLDEKGNRIIGQPVEIRWESGGFAIPTEDKPLNEYSVNFGMYNTLGSYSIKVSGLPSDTMVGMGLGTAEQPNFTIHTCFLLTFQRVTR
jgi:CRP-like cAMP-binding protein